MQMKTGILPQITPAWLNRETLIVFNLQSSEEKNVKKCIIMQGKNRSTESVRSQYFTPLQFHQIVKVPASVVSGVVVAFSLRSYRCVGQKESSAIK